MFEPSFKKGLLAVLVLCFLVQSVLVYTDHVDLELSAKAIEGRRLYHESACQVCHQLWGQGGFLGPDLTNAASRVDETRLASDRWEWSDAGAQFQPTTDRSDERFFERN